MRDDVGHSYIKFNEGLVEQCAIEKVQLFLTDLPEHYLSITSSLVVVAQKYNIIIPFFSETDVVGVIELGAVEAFNAKQVSESIAIALKASQNSEKLKKFLEKRESVPKFTLSLKSQLSNKIAKHMDYLTFFRP